MSFATRLHELYGSDDPRIAQLPDRPDAAEAHVRLDGSCDLVVGYSGDRFAELDAFVTRCASEPHRALWQRWLAATGTDVLDAGAQLASDHARLQVYLRGHYEPAT